MIKEDFDAMARVSAGTPSGDWLRRYWWPVAMSVDVGKLAHPVRVLGEDLVLFRARNGKLGLLDRHCCHRGASLEFGRVEEKGIRCSYHGWVFDPDGKCLEQPAEPPHSTFKDKVRQLSYRTLEISGIIFAYMGPDPAPKFPKIDLLFDETRNRVSWGREMHSNWLFQAENAADPHHIMTAHASVYPELALLRPDVEWEERWYGMEVTSIYPNGVEDRHHEFFPTGIRVHVVRIGDVPRQTMVWQTPIDDHRTAAFYVIASEAKNAPQTLITKPFLKKTPGVYMRVEDGWFNIVSADQDDAPINSIDEHAKREFLASSDRGIIMYRNMIKRSIELVKVGKDPIGVRRGADADEIMHFDSYKRGLVAEPDKIRDPEAGKRLGIIPSFA